MPKKKKSESQVLVPVNEKDIKFAVEVPVKQTDPASLVTIEKQWRRIPKKSVESLASKVVKEKPAIKPKGNLLLIITEKPAAAAKIADALSKNIEYFLEPFSQSDDTANAASAYYRRGAYDLSPEERKKEDTAVKNFKEYIKSLK